MGPWQVNPGLLRQQTIQVSGDLASPTPPQPWNLGADVPSWTESPGRSSLPSCPLLSAFGLWEGLQLGARRTTQLAGSEPVLRGPPWARCGPQGGGGSAGCRDSGTGTAPPGPMGSERALPAPRCSSQDVLGMANGVS